MATDLYTVEVLRRADQVVSLRLTALVPEDRMSIGPSFARMLIEDESAPGHALLRTWLTKREEEDDEVDPQQTILRVEVVSQSEGAVELEIEVSELGVIGHLEPGASWRSTAHDELGDGQPLSDAARVWRKPVAAPRRVRAASALSVIENADGVLVMDAWTLGELPAPDPLVWARLLRFGGVKALDKPALVKRDASPVITSVHVELVDGERDEAKGSIKLKNDLSLKLKGTVHARYCIRANDTTWLRDDSGEAHPSLRPGRNWLASWFPEEVLAAAPAASGPTDVAAFEELAELALLEDVETRLSILADGLCDSRDVVLAALSQVAELGAVAVPLNDAIVRTIGSGDAGLATAALTAAARVAPAGLATMFAWAAQRTDPAVAQVARELVT